MKKLLLLVVLALGVLAVPAWALGGNVTLHPSGFGEHSYSAWKAHQGLTDNTGNDDQALYFQKLTATETFAAGVAVFKGVSDLPVSDLTGLSFWRRQDGWCGAGAPRFNLRIRNTTTGMSQLFFIGCAEMVPGPTAIAPNGETYEKRTFTFPGPTACCGNIPTANTVVTSLAIIFDEGTTQFGLPLGPGFVHLDDIEIATTPGSQVPTKCWTGASDNGNRDTGPCPATGNASVSSLSVLPTALVEQPTLADMAAVWPEVNPLAWVFYPNVLN